MTSSWTVTYLGAVHRTGMGRGTIIVLILIGLSVWLCHDVLSFSYFFFLPFCCRFHGIVALPSLPVLKFLLPARQRRVTSTARLFTWKDNFYVEQRADNKFVVTDICLIVIPSILLIEMLIVCSQRKKKFDNNLYFFTLETVLMQVLIVFQLQLISDVYVEATENL